MRKMLFFIKTTYAMIVAHKIRLILVCIGVFLGVFVFSSCNLLVDSYYETQMLETNSIPENSIAIICSSKENNVHLISEYLKTAPIHMVNVLSSKTIVSVQLPDKRGLIINGNIYGIQAACDNQHIAAANTLSNQCAPINFEIIKGRNIVNSDIVNQNNVVIIDENTESLLFEDGNAIGKTIELSSNTAALNQASSRVYTLTVIGVCKNSYYSEVNVQKIKEGYNKSTDDIYVYTTIYVPYSILENDESIRDVYLFEFNNADEYNESIIIINSINMLYREQGHNLTYVSRLTLLETVNQTLLPLKALFNIILAVTLIFSGLLIMSIMLFSIKERIPEIGIRKAFGASSIDILVQYILEVVAVALIFSILGFIASYGFMYLIHDYINDNLFISYELSKDAENFFASLAVGIAQSVFFASIPCILAARVQVVQAIKYD